jgi:hypothetical protein
LGEIANKEAGFSLKEISRISTAMPAYAKAILARMA